MQPKDKPTSAAKDSGRNQALVVIQRSAGWGKKAAVWTWRGLSSVAKHVGITVSNVGEISTNRQEFLPHGAESAGAMAEEQLLFAVEKVILKHRLSHRWKVWGEVRVRHGAWRSEIDLIVSTDDMLYLLELKNWSGSLEVHDDQLVQIRRHQGGLLAHGNLMKIMRKREEAIRAWFKKHHVKPPPIERKILFYNPRLRISPAVFDYAKNEIASASQWVSDFERLAQTAKPPPSKAEAQRHAVHAAIDALVTWDVVTMHGGRSIRGDIRSSVTTIRTDDGRAWPLHDRRTIAYIRVQAPRNYLQAVFRRTLDLSLTVHLRSGAVVEAKVPLDTEIRVHAAGDKRTELMALRHLHSLRFGAM